MIIEHERLYLFKKGWGWPQCAEYSKHCEEALADLIGITNRVMAEGYHPQFDFTDSTTGETYEVKFQFHPEVDIEIEQSNNTNPSGIMLSTATYWLIVNTSCTKAGELVGKVRKYKLADLQYAVETRRLAGETKGKKKLKFTARELDHEWLGDIVIDTEARTWDLTQWKIKARPKPSFKRKSTRHPFAGRLGSVEQHLKEQHDSSISEPQVSE